MHVKCCQNVYIYMYMQLFFPFGRDCLINSSYIFLQIDIFYSGRIHISLLKTQFEKFKCCWRHSLKSSSFKLHSVVHLFSTHKLSDLFKKTFSILFQVNFSLKVKRKNNYLPLHDQVNIFSNDERYGKVFGLFSYQCPNVYCFFIYSFFFLGDFTIFMCIFKARFLQISNLFIFLKILYFYDWLRVVPLGS